MRIIVGITGASGAIYGLTLVKVLSHYNIKPAIIFTDMGKKVMEYECMVTIDQLKEYGTVYENDNLFADIASGSCRVDGMVIAPCSMNTLGSIANGLGGHLLERCASVMLKEQKKLIILARETPLSSIHLENMLKLSQAGACIMPAAPGFYHKPEQIWQLVDSIVTRILDQLHIDIPDATRWGNGGDCLS